MFLKIPLKVHLDVWLFAFKSFLPMQNNGIISEMKQVSYVLPCIFPYFVSSLLH